MTKQEAIATVETMPEEEFQAWFSRLPYRTRLCCQGGLVDWREVLGDWYMRQQQERGSRTGGKRREKGSKDEDHGEKV